MKKLTVLLAALFILALIAGCGTSPAPAQPANETQATAKPAEAAPAKQDAPAGKVKIGYAIWSGEAEDALAYGDSVKAAAEAAGFEAVYFDNKGDGQTTVTNIQNMIVQGITYVIDGKPDTSTDDAIAELIRDNGLRFITLDLPQSEGVFCGVDNKKACVPGGKALMDAAQSKWNGEFDAFIKVWNPAEGEVVADRMDSFVEGARSVKDIPADKLIDVESEATSQAAMEQFSAFLTANPNLTKMLVACENDGTAQGVLSAAQNANRVSDVLICGAGCDSLAISLMLQDTEGFIGSVNFGFFDVYGEVSVKMVQDWIASDKMPDTTYVSTSFTGKDTLEKDVPAAELERIKKDLGM